MHIETPSVASSAPAWSRCGARACAALALFATAAGAETSPYYIGASYTVSHDSNLLRLANEAETPPEYTRADTVSTTALLAGLDQRIGRQRVYGNLSLRNNRYGHNDIFNNNSYVAAVGLDWQTVERISGNLSANASRSLQSFSADLFALERPKNLESSQGFNAGLSVGLVTQYSLELNGGHRQVHNSLQDRAVQSREFSQDNASLGLRWRPSAVSSLGVTFGATRGRYPKFALTDSGEFQPDRFKRHGVALVFSYVPSGASSLEGRIGSDKTSYDLNQQRDFSGYTGSLTWLWQATGHIRINTSLGRDTGQDSYAARSPLNNATTADYSRVSTGIRTEANYEFSGKLAFVAAASYGKRELVRTIDDPFIPQNAEGSDRTTLLSLGARWAPSRTSSIGCDVGREKRAGNGQLTSSMKSSTYGCFGQITLQ